MWLDLQSNSGPTVKLQKLIVAQVGWPTKTLVGQRGARAAWLLVRHADLDVAFQRRAHRPSTSSIHPETGRKPRAVRSTVTT